MNESMENSGNARFARYAWGVLAYNIAVVLWGAVVRATGSGAGCGNHWPLCNGEVLPQAAAMKTTVEFAHRAMTGVDGPLVVLLVVWGFRAFPKGHPARLGAVLSGVFLVAEALIGAALVKLELVAGNTSAARGYWLSGHLINTMTLIACLALTAWWGGGQPRTRFAGPAARSSAISIGVVLLLAVSGAIAALGDTLFPSQSLTAGFAQDLDPAASVLLRLRAFHPMLAALAAAWLVFFGVTTPRGPATGYARAMMTLLAAQLAAGLVNLLLLAPVWMQIVHLLLADLLWISLVLLCARRLGEKKTPSVTLE
jgi:heme A synthase